MTSEDEQPARNRALDGIRVVDLTRNLAGPYCTMLLGDQGADVIKVEGAPNGDPTRRQSYPRVGDQNSAFLAANRNKRSVAIDLHRPEGIALVRELVAHADVFIENFRPGVTTEMGLSWDDLRVVNPRLVYCAVSGWGEDGPYASRPAYASTAEALGGVMSVTGERDGEPVKVGVSIVDNLTGVFAKDAITSALFARERTGVGQKVEVSLLESTVAILSMSAYAYLLGGVVARRTGSEHGFVIPWKCFRTKDGYFVVTAGSQIQWGKLLAALDCPELTEDARFSTVEGRVANRSALYELLDRIFVERSNAELFAAMIREGAAGCPVNSIDQVFTDPQVLHRQMLQSVVHTSLGEIPQVGHAQKFSGTPADIRLAPPLLGEHTDQVLSDLLGYDRATLDGLHAQRIVLGP